MINKYAEAVRGLLDAVGSSPGEVDSQVRRDLLAAKPISGALGSFAIKVQHNPTNITDEHIASLRAAGHSDEVIYEIIIAASVGAAMERLRAGLALLEIET
jgi:hypothetical protein